MTYQEVKTMENRIVVDAAWSMDLLRDNKDCLWHINPYFNQQLIFASLEHELNSPFKNDAVVLSLYNICVLQCLAILN